MIEQSDNAAPSIGISLRSVLPNSQELVLQSFVERDCETDVLNAALDKLRLASERQLAFGGLREAREQLKKLEKLALDHATRMEIAEENIKDKWNGSNRRGDVRLTDAERNAQAQARQYAQDTKHNIAVCKATIAELERITGA